MSRLILANVSSGIETSIGSSITCKCSLMYAVRYRYFKNFSICCKFDPSPFFPVATSHTGIKFPVQHTAFFADELNK